MSFYNYSTSKYKRWTNGYSNRYRLFKNWTNGWNRIRRSPFKCIKSNHIYNILNEKSPTHIITLWGDCSVSQTPFGCLKGKYDKNIGIIWFDAYPDVSGHNVERFPQLLIVMF